MMRVRVNWTGVAVVGGGLSTHYFMGTEDQTGASNAAAAVAAFWGAVDAQIGLSTSWSLDPVVAVMDSAGNQTGQFTVATATGSGSLTALYANPATQGLIRWRTGTFLNGREIRGRTFIPGIAQSTLSGGGTPTSALLSAVNTAAAALVADANSVFAVWSKTKSTVASVQSGDMWTKFAVLRSRRD